MKELIDYKCSLGKSRIIFTPIINSDEPREQVNAFIMANTVKIDLHLWKAMVKKIVEDIHYEKFLTDYFTILDEFKQIKEEFKTIKERSK